MLNNLIYTHTLNTVAASGNCEKAIRDLVSPGSLIDLFKNIAAKGFAGATAEILKPFFEKLLDFAAKVVHPVFAAVLDIVGSESFSQVFLDFVKKARAAAQCLDQYHDVWREAAEQVGVDVNTLKHVVRLLSGKSEEEIRRRVEELIKNLEKVKGEIRTNSISPNATYFYAKDWLDGVEEDGKLKICDVLLHACERGAYVEYVPNQLDETVVREVGKKAVEGGGLVVVKGGKGIGKSTAVRVALYRVLQGLLEVGGQYYKPVVVAVDKYSEFNANNFIRVAKRHGFYPIFYFDPLLRGDYPKEPSGLYQPEMSIGELCSILGKLRNVRGAVAVAVLSNDQYQMVKDLVEYIQPIDADQLLAPGKEERRKYVYALVKSYSNCHDEVVKKVADAVASQFDDGYAVAAVLAADWLGKNKCNSGEVEGAVERARRDFHRFALDYIWHVVLGRDGNVARWAAPLILAVGLFGPHPPKLGEAVAVAMSPVVEEIFGRGSAKREDSVLKWLTSPLHGILYEAIRKVANGAVYKRFGVESDELCQGSVEGPCRLVEICTKILERLPCENCNTAADIEEEYAKWVSEHFINTLIREFPQVYNVVDKLDVLSMLYGLAVLPGWDPRLKQLFKRLEGWFFIGDTKAETIGLYLYPLLKKRDVELVKRAAEIVNKAEKSGEYADVDLLRAVGIVAAGRWDSATDEELEKAMELVANALDRFAVTWLVLLRNFKFLLSEAWRRILRGETHGVDERHQRLANLLVIIADNVARGHPFGLLLFFVPEKEEPDIKSAARRFTALYNVASNVGKFWLLDTLLYTLNWDIDGVYVAAVLLEILELKLEKILEVATRRVDELVSHLDGVEKAYVVAHLYLWLAKRHASFGELDKARKFMYETLSALEMLRKSYEEDKMLTEEKLRPYLELKGVSNLGEELNELSQHVYYHFALIYMDSNELDKAMEFAKRACDLAKELGSVYYEVLSCGLLPRLKAVKEGIPPIKEPEERWQRASHAVEWLDAGAIATTLGEHVIALASACRLGEVEKTLKEWGWALKLVPTVSALTYGVLSLFNERYLKNAVTYLPEWARGNLLNFADLLHDAVEAGLFAKELGNAESVVEKRLLAYGDDAIKALLEVAPSSKLFLSALVGLTYCKRGEEWGLKLARAATRAGSGFKGVSGRLFGEFYKALERIAVGNCDIDEVLRAVYKLYYYHL